MIYADIAMVGERLARAVGFVEKAAPSYPVFFKIL
jgi:hypothetical protein